MMKQSAWRGTLAWFHPGYWQARDKGQFRFLAPAFLARGIDVALVNYPLCPDVTLAALVEATRDFVPAVLAEAGRLGRGGQMLVAAGHSAGGQLAAMLLATNWQRVHAALPSRTVEGGIGISGLYDLRPLLRVPSLMKVVSLNDERAIKLSPALMQPSSSAPFLTAVGTQENAGFLEQAAIIRSAWPSSRSTQIDCAGRNHFTILDELTSESGSIFRAALQLMSPNT